jgi:F-type H+-transporting ATPase subunit delta
MAELATIARPYAEALFRSAAVADASSLADQLEALSRVAGDAQLRQFADSPKAADAQVFDLIQAVTGLELGPAVAGLLHIVIENGRLSALPEIASQYRSLVDTRSGIAEATISSAYALDATQLADTVAVLERRFGRKLKAVVELDPTLIGGIRVVVGDEVLDTSVKARLEQMKLALIN